MGIMRTSGLYSLTLIGLFEKFKEIIEKGALRRSELLFPVFHASLKNILTKGSTSAIVP